MKRGREVLDVNMAHVLMLLSRGAATDTSVAQPSGRVFKCKTCNRQFSSFQALGGHRASHKKPRVLSEEQHSAKLSKPRVHECSICGLQFALGQALGGHMRRHRVSTPDRVLSHGSSSGGSSSNTNTNTNTNIGGGGETKDEKKRLLVELDLNLTPFENEAELRLLEFSLGGSMVH